VPIYSIEEIMINILKIVILPVLFLLPWLLLKMVDGEIIIRELLSEQPILLVMMLLPSLIIAAGWIVKLLRR